MEKRVGSRVKDLGGDLSGDILVSASLLDVL